MKELIRFTKMHGAGNDYIFLNGMESCPEDLAELSQCMSNRHTGIGSDGLVVILPSSVADFKMQMFNADGSESEMCGNASRCIGKYVFENGLTKKHHITLETLAGIRTLSLSTQNDVVVSITVDMGAPVLDSKAIPVSINTDVIMMPVMTSYGEFAITALSMGNPHGVIFVKNIDGIDVPNIGYELEHSDLFPQRANIEFAQILNPNEIKMRVWERGSGETLACGTGACATLVAGALTGKCSRQATVHLLGGDLSIEWNEQNSHVYMTGPATTVFEGTYIHSKYSKI